MSIPEVQTGFEIGPFAITNTMVWTWVLMLLITVLLLWLGKGAKLQPAGTKQAVAEWIVDAINGMTSSTMGANKLFFAPYMLSLFAFLLIANLSGFLFVGIVRPPTADWATTLALALCTFFMTQGFGLHTKGLKTYIKGFFDPLPFLFPINIIGELAPIVSLSFRLFGNILGGLIIGTLFYSMYTSNNVLTIWALAAGILLIAAVATGQLNKLKEMPKKKKKLVILVGVLSMFPILAACFVHFYFDLFAGALQAFIFTMLSMVFISNAMAD